MAEKTPDVLAVYNKISKVLMEEFGTRIVSIDSSITMGNCVNLLCKLYCELPKVRTRKKKAEKAA